MELLIIKSGEEYLRVTGAGYHLCAIDKARVFPFAKLESVKRHVQFLKKEAYKDVAIFKLILTEQPLENG